MDTHEVVHNALHGGVARLKQLDWALGSPTWLQFVSLHPPLSPAETHRQSVLRSWWYADVFHAPGHGKHWILDRTRRCKCICGSARTQHANLSKLSACGSVNYAKSIAWVSVHVRVGFSTVLSFSCVSSVPRANPHLSRSCRGELVGCQPLR